MSISAHATGELWTHFYAVDQLSTSSGEGMRKLLTLLGLSYQPPDFPESEWTGKLQTAGSAGTPAVLDQLGHPDVDVRRTVPMVLEWCWDDAAEIVPALHARLPAEPDPPARAGLLLAAGRLTAKLPPEQRAAGERWLGGFLHEEADPDLRFAAALSLTEHLVPPEARLPGEVVDALMDGLREGGDAYHDLWGVEQTPLGAAEYAFRTRRPPADLVAFLLRVVDLPPLRRELTWLLPRWSEDVQPLIPAMAGLVGDADVDPEVRGRIAGYLAGVPVPVIAQVADVFAAVLTDPVPAVRDSALHALARAGDARCLPALHGLLGGPQPTWWVTTTEELDKPVDLIPKLAGMRAHAAELLPTILERLAAVPPLTVRQEGNGFRRRGGLETMEAEMVRALGTWGAAAAPAVPALRRILGLYEAGRAPWQLPPTFYPDEGYVRTALDRIVAHSGTGGSSDEDDNPWEGSP